MNMRPEWDVFLLRCPGLIAQALILGSAMLVLILKAGDSPNSDSDNRLDELILPWWRLLALIAAVFTPVVILNEVAEMADISWLGAISQVAEVLAGTFAGRVWMWRIPATAALVVVTFIPIKGYARPLMLCLLCAALALMDSLTSHAIDDGVAAVAVRTIHEIAAGLWAGSLLTFWLGGIHAERLQTKFSIRAASALSTIALWSIATLGLSGLFLAYKGLGLSLTALLYSDYGRALTIKLVVLSAALGIAGYNRFVLMPLIAHFPMLRALIRNVRTEWLIVVVVLILAALLANTPPARMKM